MKIRRFIYLLRNKKVKWEEKCAQMSFYFYFFTNKKVLKIWIMKNMKQKE